ncbi:septal ring lytic transglycosylase RlpA family protein [Trichlorobacter sp.]|jgi:rare lipoprotein A|uniref:septal ring lytic transglycosylase RlpA family protein n=1 Tax=Trichlorobacter sp. TaxID=2911007 RepID=UPI002A369787|nr:septal ring lytic transglycosylase RlpA family protein [Trichlorobacter sp.]MDY0384244.1 septal ring lytic transglycosylase RlpA family protein [Trichlorobacter sp.]
MRSTSRLQRTGCLLAVLTLLLPGGYSFAALPESDSIDEQLEQLVRQGSPRDPRDGVATYYAARFIGRRTSSGERYQPDKLTAAHATLPLGTVVRVLNPRTGQDVVVRINDRCHPRHAPKNLIDLSRKAAQQIGLWGKGLIKVRIIPLTEGGRTTQQRLTQENAS